MFFKEKSTTRILKFQFSENEKNYSINHPKTHVCLVKNFPIFNTKFKKLFYFWKNKTFLSMNTKISHSKSAATIFLVLLLALSGNVEVLASTPKYIIPLAVNYIDFKSGILPNGKIYNLSPSKDTIWPGDIIGIMAGTRNTYLRIKNLSGSPSAPIILTNFNGKVVIKNMKPGGGLALKQSRNIRLSGCGDPALTYGILIDSIASGNNGLSLDELTTDIEVHNLEIRNTGFAGIVAKTDPSCDPATHRGNFTMKNIHIHHNYIHHTAGEGIYAGFSVYGPVVRTCSGSQLTVYAHEIHHLSIHNNLITHTGLDGIQIGCATHNIEVFDNTITHSGILDNTYAKGYGMEGIVVGGGSTGRYYNNHILDSYGSGIFVFGTGEVHVFNNVIVRPGRLSAFPSNQHYAYGIYSADRTTQAGASFYYINNTIVSPRTSGIKITSTQSRKNRVYNNIVLDPQTKHFFGNHGSNWLQSCIQISAGSHVIQQANHFDTVYYPGYHGLYGNPDPYFTNAATGDFSLTGSSALIDAAIAADSVSGFGFDAALMPRPGGYSWDIGAFEYQPETENVLNPQGNSGYTPSINHIPPKQNPIQESSLPQWRVWWCSGAVHLQLTGNSGIRPSWALYRIDGLCIAQGICNSSESTHQIFSGNLKTGVYLVRLMASGISEAKKIAVH